MSFATLPSELIIQICGHLELIDWCALRLTCKTLFLRTWERFADSSFQTICVLITSEGLSRLAALAADENLRPRVKELWIVPTLFEGSLDKEYSPPGPIPMALNNSFFSRGVYAEGLWTDTEIFNRFTAYQAMVADHCQVLDTGAFTSALRKSLACFNNLGGVGLRSCPTWVLLDSSRPMKFPCLGVRHLRDQLPCHRTVRSSGYSERAKATMGDKHARVFLEVIDAVVTAQQKLQRLETCDRHHCGVAAQDLITLTTKPQYQQFLQLLQTLENLHLCLCSTGKVPARDEHGDRLRGILEMVVTAAPGLRTLTFSLSCTPEKHLKPQLFSQLAQRVYFTRLVEVELRDLDTTRDDLRAFLRSATTTLQRLSLSSISLAESIQTASPWNPRASRADRKQWQVNYRAEIVHRWQTVWANLYDDLPSLRYLYMGNLLFRGHPIDVSDPLWMRSGRSRQTCHARAVAFDADHAQIPLGEWIRQLKANASEMVMNDFLPEWRWVGRSSTPHFVSGPFRQRPSAAGRNEQQSD
ncbi:F-box protein [Aspergillus saccharolyticus JOP 1030-1]|uniref:F-box domain-containing protein n=1 Tax=Aspergillus saccharolyticus JOP 1030-1 TaxID=1450539 RepID=A0A319AST9_9EURO|nr:hypothetical protein BP01DRAFT_378879 [Aspergillus saccharolyticus JOP 1030-1]PYH49312.1 hypothetical protein BP01DRAFT_378879 [Aspergillus saccharolyticus JOP 1030-1]